VALAARTAVSPDGALLVGGRPLRLVRLAPGDLAHLSPLLRGEELAVSAENCALVERLLDLDLLQARPEATGPGRERVTVVVPVRDHAGELRELLGAPDAWEGVAAVVVVDDASCDGPALREALAGRGPVEVQLVRCESRRGPAGARNRGAALATTELVAFVDADCRPGPRWLEALVAHFDDPSVAAVAPRVRADPSPGGHRSRLGPPLLAFERARGPLDAGPEPTSVGPGRELTLVPSAALVVRRSAFEAVGGFDPTLRFGEDCDLEWRLVEAGWTVRYEPSVVVRHPVRPGLAAALRQRFEYGLPAAALARRHRRFRLLRVEPLTFASMVAAATGNLGLAAGVGLAGLVGPAARGAGAGLGWRLACRRRAAEQMADAKGLAASLWRTYWPLTVLLCPWSRTFRRLAVAALVVGPLLDRVRSRPEVPLVWWVLLQVAEGLAGGAGVWVGCARERSVAVLVPQWKKGWWRPCSIGAT
jgi:mycofactocin system glycosyltransferase